MLYPLGGIVNTSITIFQWIDPCETRVALTWPGAHWGEFRFR